MPLQLIRDDLLHFKVEAIVNSANPKPYFYSGVDKTIYVNAGENLLKDRKRIGMMEVSQVEITSAHNLPCEFILHVVSPHWYKTEQPEMMLKKCYLNCLELAKQKDIKSIAFPLLASGNNKFPKEVAMQIALQSIEEFLLKEEMMVYLAIYDKSSYSISKKLFGDIQSYIDDNYVNLDKNIRLLNECAPASHQLCLKNERTLNRETFEKKDLYFEAAEESVAYDSFPSLDFKVESTFQEHLFYLIDQKGLDDVEVYKKANIDKKLFSKIRSNKNYHPKKETVLALCISMKLGIDDTKDLLMKAGYAFSNANLMDVIIQYCIERNEYDINKINIILFDYKQKTLGV